MAPLSLLGFMLLADKSQIILELMAQKTSLSLLAQTFFSPLSIFFDLLSPSAFPLISRSFIFGSPVLHCLLPFPFVILPTFSFYSSYFNTYTLIIVNHKEAAFGLILFFTSNLN